jgi:hypothetical protein
MNKNFILNLSNSTLLIKKASFAIQELPKHLSVKGRIAHLVCNGSDPMRIMKKISGVILAQQSISRLKKLYIKLNIASNNLMYK